jgi:methyltransferase (TIGR00027 family)
MDDRPVPDRTAVRVALWRALHLDDPPPHVIEDEIGLRLADPGKDWRSQPDMNRTARARVRATVVARSRFIEDLVLEQAGKGLSQYVILGAGLDSFAQRHPAGIAGLSVFEIDQPATQAWKRRRLASLGFSEPPWLRFAPVDFETEPSWKDALSTAGFDAARPALMAAAGLSMYLTRSAVMALLSEAAALARGSTLVMTFQLPTALLEPGERPGREMTLKAAEAMGTPFLSLFSPDDILGMARDAGFSAVRHVSAADTAACYFTGRPDGLRPSSAEEILVAVS